MSVSTEAFHRLMTMRALYRRLGINASATRDAPELLRTVRRSFGGRLVLLDWDAGEVIADKAIAGASGVATDGRTVIACSWIDQCIYVLTANGTEVTVTHPWFNYMHSVDVTPRDGFLVASAGSDLIIEVTGEGKALWEWFGPEHGYDTRPDGQPAVVDRTCDYRLLRTSTAEQTMHVTAALEMSADTVLATLFHQGALVAIDRRTGRVHEVIGGLCRPHGIHRREGGFMLSDTLGHRIVLLDDDLRVYAEIPFGSEWLQDAISITGGGYLALENVHIDQLPEPALTNMMTEIDCDGRPIRGVDVGPDCRLFTVREVDEGLASGFAETWGKSGDFDRWRWT